MKILFLTNIPSPYRVDFFNELGKMCELTVLFERKGAQNRDGSWYGEKFESFNAVFLKGVAVGEESSFCPEVLGWLKKDFDVIVIGGYSTPTGMLATEYLRFTKKPFWLNCDGGIVKDDTALKFRIKKHFISAADGWLSPSEATDGYLLHYGAKREKIRRYAFTSVSRAGIAPPCENKAQLKKALGITEDIAVISAGQFIPRKGHDVLIEAFSHVDKKAGLYIIGGEPTEEYLQLKEKHGLGNVHFVGFCNKEKLKKYYAAGDVFALATREDIWGLVINEAMAAGLPVISTENCVAACELIENGINGIVVPVEDAEKTAAAINLLVANPSKCRQMGLANVEKSREMTVEKMAQRHIEIFME